MSRILVTGASGFVGREVAQELTVRGERPRVVLHHGNLPEALRSVEAIRVADIGRNTDWAEALDDVQKVVHLAARAHVMRDSAADPLAAFRAVNVEGTLRLAKEAATRGVQRMVFISSIKVNGERTLSAPYSERDPPAPEDAYGISKREAEDGLRGLAKQTGIEVVILRLPLVYGPGVRANFLRLMHLIERGWPIPLGGVDNRRSLVFVGNLVSAILAALDQPAAADQTFLVSDGQDLSTPELICHLASAMGCRARLVGVPVGLVKAMATMLGLGGEIDRLVGSLQIDSRLIRSVLNWQPPFSVEEGIHVTVRQFMAKQIA